MDQNENEMLKKMLEQMLLGIVNIGNTEDGVKKIEPIPEVPKKDTISPIAKTLRNSYEAFMEVGFDETQAYELAYCILDHMLEAAMGKERG